LILPIKLQSVVVVPKELGTSKERIKPSQSDWASPAGRAERTWYVKKKNQTIPGRLAQPSKHLTDKAANT
jgi:hypothetical protein